MPSHAGYFKEYQLFEAAARLFGGLLRTSTIMQVTVSRVLQPSAEDGCDHIAFEALSAKASTPLAIPC